MKFWTVQKKEIIDTVNQDGIYQPDFSKSDYLQIIPSLKNLYYIVLKAFNHVNDMQLPGLVYAFFRSDDKMIYQIENIHEFYTFIRSRKSAISSLWEQLSKNDVMVVELNYKEEFNPIFVDINDFVYLMSPNRELYPYTMQDAERIINEMYSGQITRSVFPSNVIQAHLPYIKVENVINTYPMFDLD